MLPHFFLDSGTGSQKACRDNNSRFRLVIHGVNDVLQEHQVYIHAALFLLGDIGYAGEEPLLFVVFARQRLPIIAEIHVEWRIADDIVEFSQCVLLSVQMPGRDQGIIMYHVAQGVDKVIQNQIQTQELVGLGGDVLRVDGTVLLADLVGKRQHQRTGTGSQVIYRYVADLSLYHNPGYDGSDRMRCVIFGILAGIFVVVVDKILKDLRKEVIFLLKHLGKVKLYQLIDDGAAEQRFFRTLNDILGDRLKQLDLFLAACLDGENVQIEVGNVRCSSFCEIILI